MVDLSKNGYIGKCIKAQANDNRQVLILRKLDSPFKRFDGKRVSYELEYRWVSADVTPEGDEVCCVMGEEFSYYSKRELNAINAMNKNCQLFDSFQLF